MAQSSFRQWVFASFCRVCSMSTQNWPKTWSDIYVLSCGTAIRLVVHGAVQTVMRPEFLPASFNFKLVCVLCPQYALLLRILKGSISYCFYLPQFSSFKYSFSTFHLSIDDNLKWKSVWIDQSVNSQTSVSYLCSKWISIFFFACPPPPGGSCILLWINENICIIEAIIFF